MLFAGGTVVISLLGLFVIGVSFIRGLAVGASLAVLFVMAAAVTLLPAVLGFVGHTIDKFALPEREEAAATSSTASGPAGAARSRRGRGRPRSAGSLILLVLAVPFFSLRLGVADAGNDPTKLTTRRAYDLLSEGFGPGLQRPAARRGRRRRAGRSPTATTRLQAAIAADPDVAQVSPVIPSPNGKGVLIQVRAEGLAAGREHDRSSCTASATTSIPAATQRHRRSTCTSAARPRSASTSPTRSGQRLPYMFVAILLLSFMLLMLVFRSLLVPLKAVIMNLLSIGAAYGVIVAIFQWGWVEERGRHRQGRPDRGVGADDAVRDRVRPLDGLRGVPPQPHQGGVRRARRQLRSRSRTASPRPPGSSPPRPRS